MGRLRVALCQLDTVVGDVDGNVERVLAALGCADEAGCDLAAFPELALTGYPPEDLLLKPAFVAANLAGLERVAAGTTDCVAVVGFVDIAGAGRGTGNSRRAGKSRPRRGDARRSAAAQERGGRVRVGQGRRRVLQEASSQLRRVRRGALVCAGNGRPSRFGGGRSQGRCVDL